MSSWRNPSPMHSGPPPNSTGMPQGMTLANHNAVKNNNISNNMVIVGNNNGGGNMSNNTMNGNGNVMENGPRAKCDQVVFEAIAKAAEIVVGSRCWIDNYPSQNNSSVSSSSRRFNLLVPEVQGVRSILQRWKRALHVPLRLDVYYQHEDSRRELLERWCLEYAPKTSTYQGFAGPSTDPIVQLRHVCKQIVIWLRSLYCWSRMLPSQALRSLNTNNSAIGFSIYVVSEGNDDVSGLVSQQGFSSQAQPHSVWTPYGELGWKVFYAPKEVVQRLIPETPPYTSNTSSRPVSQPIPMQQRQQQQQVQQLQPQSYHPSRDMIRRDSSPPGIARSAPHDSAKHYLRSKSDVSDAAHHAMSVAAAMQNGGELHTMGNRPIPGAQEVPVGTEYSVPLSTSADSKPPIKNRSALSLAMMMVNDEDGTAEQAANNKEPTSDEVAEKRRAALHHAPPQLPNSPVLNKKAPLGNPGEYGYAYNNHIPPLRTNSTPPNHPTSLHVPPLGTTPSRSDGLASPSMASTPVPLASTPPGGFFLGGPASQGAVPNLTNLIPPRGAVTPPFTRPAGFVGEPPSQPLPPAATPQASNSAVAGTSNVGAGVPPTTSLDLLHSSPFQQPAYGSMFGGGSMTAGDPFASSGAGDPGLLFGGSVGSGGLLIHPRLQALDDPDDMPFAVDTSDGLGDGGDGSESALGQGGASASGNPMGSFASSAMMRDMSQPPKRLQLFDTVAAESALMQQDQAQDALGALASQLAEFKTFGASLTIQPTGASMSGDPNQGDVGASSSASTPISLRT